MEPPKRSEKNPPMPPKRSEKKLVTSETNELLGVLPPPVSFEESLSLVGRTVTVSPSGMSSTSTS